MYSYQTSYPAWLENQSGKLCQQQRVLRALVALGGTACLKQLEKILQLPQSTISGRINDLISDNKVRDSNTLTFFEGRKRKLFEIVFELPKPKMNLEQAHQPTFFD